MEKLTLLTEKYRSVLPALNKLARRRWAAVEAQSLGRGGICAVAKATGLSRTTIYVGLRELRQSCELPVERVRRPGGGRKPVGREATRRNPLCSKPTE